MTKRASIWQIWLSAGVALLFIGGVLFATTTEDLAELEAIRPEQGVWFEAVIGRQAKLMAFDTAKSGRITCTPNRCNYPSSDVDRGQSRRFLMASGWLVGLERDGRVIDVRSGKLAHMRSSLKFLATMAFLSLPCFGLAYATHRHRSQQQQQQRSRPEAVEGQ